MFHSGGLDKKFHKARFVQGPVVREMRSQCTLCVSAPQVPIVHVHCVAIQAHVLNQEVSVSIVDVALNHRPAYKTRRRSSISYRSVTLTCGKAPLAVVDGISLTYHRHESSRPRMTLQPRELTLHHSCRLSPTVIALRLLLRRCLRPGPENLSLGCESNS